MTAPKTRNTTILAAKRLTAAACALPLVAFGAVACGDDSVTDTAESVASEVPTTLPGGEGADGEGEDADGQDAESGDADDDNGGEEGAEPVPSTTIEGADGGEVSIDDEAILAAYAEKDYADGYLGKPLGPVVNLPGGGKFITLEGGSIYVHPQSNEAFIVQGDIGEYWGEQGHEEGPLGYPTSNETRTENGGLEQTYDNGTLVYENGEVSEQE